MDRNEELLKELKTYEKTYKKILKQLVVERIKETSSNRFKLEEIEYWSKHFEISMTEFIYQVLQLDRDSYSKILKGQKSGVESNRYIKFKNKFLNSKSKKYLYNRNLNIRNYYNKEKLISQSEVHNINLIDFCANILKKSKNSFKSVINDETGKRRLFIGRNVNAKLPIIYMEKNNEELYIIVKRNVNRVVYLRGIYINKEDRADLVQDCVNYIFENGNMLDKRGNLIIKDGFAKERVKRRMFSKAYYYIMNNIGKYREMSKSFEYDENRNYNNSSDDDIEKCIFENINDKMEQDIFLMLYRKGNDKTTINEISNKYNLSLEEINEILNRNRIAISNKF